MKSGMKTVHFPLIPMRKNNTGPFPASCLNAFNSGKEMYLYGYLYDKAGKALYVIPSSRADMGEDSLGSVHQHSTW